MPLLSILIVGDAGVGKTNLATKLTSTRFFEERYIETKTIKELIGNSFKIYDFPGQQKSIKIDNYPEDIDKVIIMYDITNSISYKSIEFWEQNIRKKYDDIDIIKIGNKIEKMNACKKFDANLINISVKKEINIQNLLNRLL